jgi:hypothetical protein
MCQDFTLSRELNAVSRIEAFSISPHSSKFEKIVEELKLGEKISLNFIFFNLGSISLVVLLVKGLNLFSKTAYR